MRTLDNQKLLSLCCASSGSVCNFWVGGWGGLIQALLTWTAAPSLLFWRARVPIKTAAMPNILGVTGPTFSQRTFPSQKVDHIVRAQRAATFRPLRGSNAAQDHIENSQDGVGDASSKGGLAAAETSHETQHRTSQYQQIRICHRHHVGGGLRA